MPGEKQERENFPRPPNLERLLITPNSFCMVGGLLKAMNIPVEAGMPPDRKFQKGPIRDSIIIVPSDNDSRELVPFRIIIEQWRDPQNSTTWRLESLGTTPGEFPENEPVTVFNILVGGYSKDSMEGKKGFEGIIHLDERTQDLDIGLDPDNRYTKVITAGRYRIVGLHFDSQSHRVFFIGRPIPRGLIEQQVVCAHVV